jgi:hypothetical protein
LVGQDYFISSVPITDEQLLSHNSINLHRKPAATQSTEPPKTEGSVTEPPITVGSVLGGSLTNTERLNTDVFSLDINSSLGASATRAKIPPKKTENSGTPDTAASKSPVSEDKPKTDIERIVKHWADNYVSLLGHQPVNPNKGKIGKLLKDLLVQLSVDDIISILDRGMHDSWVIDHGYGLSILLASEVINRLRDSKGGKQAAEQDANQKKWDEAVKQRKEQTERARANPPTKCECGAPLRDGKCPSCGKTISFSEANMKWEFLDPLPDDFDMGEALKKMADGLFKKMNVGGTR